VSQMIVTPSRRKRQMEREMILGDGKISVHGSPVDPLSLE